MGLNPLSERMSEGTIKRNIEAQRTSTNDREQLTKEEKEYWSNHAKLEHPLKMAYTCAYKEIIDKSHWINLVLLLYVIVVFMRYLHGRSDKTAESNHTVNTKRYKKSSHCALMCWYDSNYCIRASSIWLYRNLSVWLIRSRRFSPTPNSANSEDYSKKVQKKPSKCRRPTRRK